MAQNHCVIKLMATVKTQWEILFQEISSLSGNFRAKNLLGRDTTVKPSLAWTCQSPSQDVWCGWPWLKCQVYTASSLCHPMVFRARSSLLWPQQGWDARNRTHSLHVGRRQQHPEHMTACNNQGWPPSQSCPISGTKRGSGEKNRHCLRDGRVLGGQ